MFKPMIAKNRVDDYKKKLKDRPVLYSKHHVGICVATSIERERIVQNPVFKLDLYGSWISLYKILSLIKNLYKEVRHHARSEKLTSPTTGRKTLFVEK